MQRLVAALVAAVLLIICGSARADFVNHAEGVWTDAPGGYVHLYDDCSILLQEGEYDLILGTLDQAVSGGKVYLCRACTLRMAHANNTDVQVAGQYTLGDLSDDELEYFCAVYDAELLRRRGSSYTLYPGIYIVGTDIPAGAWRMELQSGTAELALYRDIDTYNADFSVALFDKIFSVSWDDAIIGKMQLNMGNILQVEGTFVVSPFLGMDK